MINIYSSVKEVKANIHVLATITAVKVFCAMLRKKKLSGGHLFPMMSYLSNGKSKLTGPLYIYMYIYKKDLQLE